MRDIEFLGVFDENFFLTVFFFLNSVIFFFVFLNGSKSGVDVELGFGD